MTAIYEGPAVRTMYRRLIDRYGGMDAAAALIGVTKTTISRQCSGDQPIRVEHFCPLEDAVEFWPITELLHARIAGRGTTGDLARVSAQMLRELGDVPAACLEMMASGEIEAARIEAQEALAAIEHFLGALSAQGEA